jgi:hypothetical protein
VRPVRRVQEDHQMNELESTIKAVQSMVEDKKTVMERPSMNEDEDEDKPTPADKQLVWALVAFIVLMLGLLTLRSCL